MHQYGKISNVSYNAIVRESVKEAEKYRKEKAKKEKKLTENRKEIIRKYCEFVTNNFYGFDFDSRSVKNWRGTSSDWINSIGNNPETGKPYNYIYDIRNNTFIFN